MFDGATSSTVGYGASAFFWAEWCMRGVTYSVASLPKRVVRSRMVRDGLTSGWLGDITPNLGT
jgi:hypothetical protein